MTDKCREFLPKIHDWLEGYTDEETSLLVQWHLRNCHRCQRVVEEWQSTAREIGSLLSVPAPEGFEEKLKAKSREIQLLSWREMAVSWFLTSGCTAFAIFWFGMSSAEILRFFSQWMLSMVSWSNLHTQWLQRVLELVRNFV